MASIIVKRPFSHSLSHPYESITEPRSRTQEVQQTPKRIARPASSASRKSTESKSSSRQQTTGRQKPSKGNVEALQCKSRLKSSKMMPRHPLQCQNSRITVKKNTDAKKEKRIPKITVTFAPLPESIRDERFQILKCRTCDQACKNKCTHCKRRFCFTCWTDHVNSLKDELENINEDLELSVAKFENRIHNFQSKADQTKEFVNRDIENKIAILNKKRKNRVKKVEEILLAGETSVEDIKRRMHKAQNEIKEQKEGSYDLLPDNEEKVKTFLKLQQKAAELIAVVAIWESELNNIETRFGRTKECEESFVNENARALYKRKTFAPKIIVNRDMVQRPSALAVDTWRDHIIATCPGSGQVVIFDRKFKLLRRIRHREMIAPQGVAFLQEHEEIYVTDRWKHCIFVFDGKGELLRCMCSKGQGESQLRSPEGIAFHPERNVLYIADTGNDRIQILEKDGMYLDSIGPTGKPRKISQVVSQLNQPTDVAVTTTRIVVADCGNHKVKIFDHNGKILQTIGGMGTSKGLFRLPEVLEIDRKGNIIVGDAGNGRVQIFSSEGEFLRILGAKQNRKNQFGWVSGVLVTKNYNIYVADSRNNVIYSF